MAKHAGCMYDPKGIQNTTRGELALACPACPIPGLNLPTGWENVPLEDRFVVCLDRTGRFTVMFHRFLYQLYVAIDANFKLKAKNRGAKVVKLSDGYAYFMQNADYAHHLSENTDDMKEVRLTLALSLTSDPIFSAF